MIRTFDGFLAPALASASTIQSTAPAGWSVLELEPTNDECWFDARLLDSAAARSNSYVHRQQIPESVGAESRRVGWLSCG